MLLQSRITDLLTGLQGMHEVHMLIAHKVSGTPTNEASLRLQNPEAQRPKEHELMTGCMVSLATSRLCSLTLIRQFSSNLPRNLMYNQKPKNMLGTDLIPGSSPACPACRCRPL